MINKWFVSISAFLIINTVPLILLNSISSGIDLRVVEIVNAEGKPLNNQGYFSHIVHSISKHAENWLGVSIKPTDPTLPKLTYFNVVVDSAIPIHINYAEFRLTDEKGMLKGVGSKTTSIPLQNGLVDDESIWFKFEKVDASTPISQDDIVEVTCYIQASFFPMQIHLKKPLQDIF